MNWIIKLFSPIVLVIGLLIFATPRDTNFREISSTQEDFYNDKIQPILDARCVTCHSCYNSPCQLNLGSFEGLERGANKDFIYAFNPLKAKKPTRLFIDAQTSKEWHDQYKFFPILNRNEDKTIAFEKSLLWKMLQIKEDNPHQKANFDSENSRSCPKIQGNELTTFAKESPFAGMPYGFPKLQGQQLEDIKTWIDLGAPGPVVKSRIPKGLIKNVQKWEDFFNQKSIKRRITSRYIYEHLAFAHIYFSKNQKVFFRLVRSKTKSGVVEEIPTVRPYNDPKVDFYYRFRLVTETIVHKTHIPYKLDNKRMQRYEELFIKPRWENEGNLKLPSYNIKQAANPFITFEQMPIKSRYQYLLDSAHYHIRTFIRGPVCRGQAALNVINDQFWVFFLDPESDLTVQVPEFMKKYNKLMTPPAARQSTIGLYQKFRRSQSKFRKKRSLLYDKYRPDGIGKDDIWDGDGINDNAVLTVYRHFSSATVLKGAHGQIPKTVWVIDYPILEDIYYNLVAGYNVYGAGIHQLRTRFYMENSRVNSQDFFIDLLPKESRLKIRRTFSLDSKKPEKREHNNKIFKAFPTLYRGANASKKAEYQFPYYGEERGSKDIYKTNDHKREAIEKILFERMNTKVRGPIDSINCCDNKVQTESTFEEIVDSKNKLERMFRSFSGVRAPFTQALPEVSYLRIRRKEKRDLVYTIIRNTAHYNVSYLFKEDDNLRPEHNTLNIIPGLIGSYPNYFFVTELDQASSFLYELSKLDSNKDSDFLKTFYKRYGVHRLSKGFWKHFDWFQKRHFEDYPIEGGVLDLNRYENY